MIKHQTRKTYPPSPVWTFHHRGRDGPHKTDAWKSRVECVLFLQRTEKKKANQTCFFFQTSQSLVSLVKMEIRNQRETWKLTQEGFAPGEGNYEVRKRRALPSLDPQPNTNGPVFADYITGLDESFICQLLIVGKISYSKKICGVYFTCPLLYQVFPREKLGLLLT